ncbi:hypothetical protein D3C72_1586310 [compost metagenome]
MKRAAACDGASCARRTMPTTLLWKRSRSCKVTSAWRRLSVSTSGQGQKVSMSVLRTRPSIIDGEWASWMRCTGAARPCWRNRLSRKLAPSPGVKLSTQSSCSSSAIDCAPARGWPRRATTVMS